MQRRHYIYAGLAVACTAFIVAVGVIIKPSDEEVALMQLQDHRYTEALKLYQDLKQHGDVSLNVVIPLVHAYEQEGDMENAVSLMQMYVKDHPDLLRARQSLSRLYIDSDMTEEYVHSLEVEVAMQPTAVLLRELADRYNFKGDYVNEAKTLSHLIAREDYAPREEDYFKVANYQSIEHHNSEALATLAALLDIHKFAVGGNTMDLLVDLLLDQGKPNQAMQMAAAYASDQKNALLICHFASLFSKRSQPLFALALLNTASGMADENGELLAARIDAEINSRWQWDDYTEMLQSFKEGGMNNETVPVFADLAIARAGADTVHALIPRLNYNPDLNDEAKHTFASQLLDGGHASDAETLLPGITAKEAPENTVFAALIDSRHQQDKVASAYAAALHFADTATLQNMAKKRAMITTGNEQLKWLSYLEELGQRKAIIDVVENTHGSSSQKSDLYVDALIATNQNDKLDSVLTRKLAASDAPALTKKITLTAQGENLNGLAESGFKNVLAHNPGDPDAQRFLGLQAFGRGHSSEAEPLLTAYLKQTGKTDIEVEYTLGEIMWHKKLYDKALAYYAKAMNAIEAKPQAPFEDRVMQAHILYRQKKTDKSLQLFRKLVSEKPANKMLRADFANILIEMKQYQEAEELMGEK